MSTVSVDTISPSNGLVPVNITGISAPTYNGVPLRTIPVLADTAAPNNTLFIHDVTSHLKWKGASGTVTILANP